MAAERVSVARQMIYPLLIHRDSDCLRHRIPPHDFSLQIFLEMTRRPGVGFASEIGYDVLALRGPQGAVDSGIKAINDGGWCPGRRDHTRPKRNDKLLQAALDQGRNLRQGLVAV